MFKIQTKLEDLLCWFKGSKFEYLLIYVNNPFSINRVIDELICQEQYIIDEVTGDELAYVYYDSSNEPNTNGHKIKPITKSPLGKQQMYSNQGMVRDIIRRYKISNYELPALLLIDRWDLCCLYPVKTAEEFEKYLRPLGIVRSFKEDLLNIEQKAQRPQKLRDQLEHEKLYSGVAKGGLVMLKKKLNIWDDELFQRIEGSYNFLLNLEFTDKKRFNRLFHLNLDRERIFRRAHSLGMSEEHDRVMEQLISDCEKIDSFDGFSLDEPVMGTLLKHRARLQDEIRTTEDNIHRQEAAISRLLQDIEDAEALRPALGEEKKKIEEVYKRELESVLYTNCSDLLKMIENNEARTIPKLLDYIKNKSMRIDIALEAITSKIRDKAYDIFISCKSEDYDGAKEVYEFLRDLGHKPFLADQTLRGLGSDRFGELIREIIHLPGCRTMIAYASKAEFLSTNYVRSEWNQFLDEMNLGLKAGKLFSIIHPSITTAELPAGLANRQYFTFSNYRDLLPDYLLKES